MAQPSVAFVELEPASEPRVSPARRSVVQPTPLGLGALVVVPTYNECANIGTFVAAVLRAAPAAHVLVVDDNSPDGTGQVAAALSARDARVHVLHRPGKQGLGTAYVAGFRWGLARSYGRFFEMDADFSHAPAELVRFFAALDAGAEVVVGSRNVPGGKISGWGLGRLVLSKGGSLYSRAVLGVGVHDLTTGYKAFSRRALERLGLEGVRSNGYAFQIETTFRALRAGLDVVEVPITFVDRRVGESKLDGNVFWEAVGIVWRLRFDAARPPP